MFSASTNAPKGREMPITISAVHAVNGQSMLPPWAPGLQEIVFGLGCFWGAERLFWEQSGVVVTSVGYAGGITPNPTYDETCSGRTGHAEVVRVVFDPTRIDLEALLGLFWEAHDPTQGNRQGNDIGSQYRSIILTCNAHQQQVAERSREVYNQALASAGRGPVTTEITALDNYYFAEEYHQQYLHKNPGGYCGLQGTGVSCPLV